MRQSQADLEEHLEAKANLEAKGNKLKKELKEIELKKRAVLARIG